MLTSGLDNRNRGTVAANDLLVLNTSGAVQNDADGLIYSQNGGVEIDAASLTNGKGVVQSQGGLKLTVDTDIDNQSGRIQAKAGDVSATGRHFDNRGGVLASLQGMLTTQLTGVLKNGYDLNNNRQGGITQAQRLNLTARGGLDNYGGRISAQTGDATVTTGNFDNRNGGLYAKGKVNVSANDFDNSGDNDGQIAGSQIDLDLTGALNNRQGIIESDSTLAIKAASLDNQTGQLRALGGSGTTNFQIGGLFDNRNGTLETANNGLILNAANFQNLGGSLLHVGSGDFDISTANLTNAGGSLVTRGGLTLTAKNWTNSSVIQAGRLTVNVDNLTQTGTGQLLASTSLEGDGENWSNDGLIASDGSISLVLGGSYGGNGRYSSLGNLALSAASMNLGSTGSVASGADATLKINGQLNNYGRMTAASALTVNAGSINNYGTLGSGGNLRLVASSLLNQNGLIFSGADMALRVNDFTNRFADVYGTGNISISRDDSNAWSASIANISASIESGGDLNLAADRIENRKDVFEATGGLVSGYIGIKCYACAEFAPYVGYKEDGYMVWVENYTSQIVQDSASANMTAGKNLLANGRDFLNQASTVSAGDNLTLSLQTFANSGASVGDYSVRRSFNLPHNADESMAFWESVLNYNAANDPFYYNQYQRPSLHAWSATDVESMFTVISKPGGRGDNPYTSFGIVHVDGGPDNLDPAHYNDGVRTDAPAAVKNAAFFENTITYNGPSNFASAVVQAGGTVHINATQNLTNSVVREGVTLNSGASKVGSTQLSGQVTPAVIQINGQLPPNLAQQQLNPLTLPGFSLPSGQNGLFRLSGQGGSAQQATQANSAPQSWSMASNSISTAQRQQDLPDTQARSVQIGEAAQLVTADRQLTQVTRQATDSDVNTRTLDASAPIENGGHSLPMPSRNSSTGVATQVERINITGASLIPTAQAVPTVGNAVATPASSQTVARVQGVPDTSFKSNPQKYLIETNPVLTELKSFMSSDYLLGELNYDPDQSAKRLGDGLYEQRLIQQAVVARTGQRFIDGQTSDEGMFKYLMDNAIASKQELGLSVGVTLTSEQVAALTHDIVWLEEHEVNGEKVLVPVLYMAQVNNRLAPNGALIQGADVKLIAGQDLTNAGTLRATNNLSASAGNDLVNSGLIEAGDRLDLLAGNNIVNKAGGVIAGRDVSMVTLLGDVINERSVGATGDNTHLHREFVDSAARIEAANDLSINTGRDFISNGGVLDSGRDTRIDAGRDVNIVTAEQRNSANLGKQTSSITQYGSTLDVGRDLIVRAGRDIAEIGSQIDAKRDIGMTAVENILLSSAADETHSYSKSKKLTTQEDHVKQVGSSLTAGGDVTLDAGKDMTLISTRITAGDEAYLVAGDKLELLAAQDSDYSLYDKKKKGSWGSKQTQRDEVTKVVNVGSEITTGGDLTIESGGDQRYQVAKLNSGNDLNVSSGGDITFESVKDLHQESHEKSKSSAAWFSMKGKGHTDETVRQSELTAQGDLVIYAVGKIHADVRQVNKQTVTESIDAMVKADPKLAWLKELDAQGGVDWRQVQEIHTSFKYANSGLGPAAQMIIAILMTVLLGPAGAGLGGWALAGASSLATTGTVATINNNGDIGAGYKAVLSKDGLTNAAIAAITAGVAENYLGDMTMTKQVNGKTVIDLSSIEAVSHFAGQQLINNASAAAIAKAFGRDVTLAGILQSAVYNTLAAYSFDQAGNLGLKTGSPEKIALHALVGGMIAEASGSDFAVGAMAAGVNETFANQLRRMAAQMSPENRDHLMLMSSQLLGVVAAAAVAGDDANALQTGTYVAGNATQYNNLNHHDMSDFVGDMNACGSNETCQKNTWVGGKYEQISNEITDWSEKAVSGAFAKSLLTSIQGGLTALKDLNCTTATCTQYKDTLTERALTDLTNLAKVTDQWENAVSLASLVIPGSGGARGPGAVEGGLTPRVQAALDKFLEARATRTGVSTGKNSNPWSAVTDSEAAISGLPKIGSLKGEAEVPPPNAPPDMVRSIQRQNEAAKEFAKAGYDVEQLPNQGSKGEARPDLRINGELADVYSPTTTSAISVLKTVAYKVQKQADNIVLNLADSPLSIEAIEQALKVNPVDKLKRLFVMKGDSKRVIEVQR